MVYNQPEDIQSPLRVALIDTELTRIQMNARLWFGLCGFFLLFAVMFYFRPVLSRLEPSITSSSPVTKSSPSPAVTQPTAVPGAYPIPLTYVAPEKTYQELSVTTDRGEFQLDARVLWQKLAEQSGLLKVHDGDTVSWEATGTVCEPEPVGYGCSGPVGMSFPPDPWVEHSLVRPQEFPLGHAYANELILRVGTVILRAGARGRYTVPAGTGEQWIEMMHNIRVQDLPKAREGSRVDIVVERR